MKMNLFVIPFVVFVAHLSLLQVTGGNLGLSLFSDCLFIFRLSLILVSSAILEEKTRSFILTSSV